MIVAAWLGRMAHANRDRVGVMALGPGGRRARMRRLTSDGTPIGFERRGNEREGEHKSGRCASNAQHSISLALATSTHRRLSIALAFAHRHGQSVVRSIDGVDSFKRCLC